MVAMTDEREILNLLAKYCELYDAGDLEGYAGLFARGAIASPDGVTHRGAAEVLAHQVANCIIYPDGTPRTAHMISNVAVYIDDAGDTARAQCYFQVMQDTEALPLQAISTGRYLDTLRKHDGVWWFEERTAVVRFVGDLSHHWRAAIARG